MHLEHLQAEVGAEEDRSAVERRLCGCSQVRIKILLVEAGTRADVIVVSSGTILVQRAECV